MVDTMIPRSVADVASDGGDDRVKLAIEDAASLLKI